MKISAFQKIIEEIYFERDSKRGVDKTFVWFVEEVGELAKEIRRLPTHSENQNRLKEEFSDVFAWLATLASLLDIELEEAARIYSKGCPKCHRMPCEC